MGIPVRFDFSVFVLAFIGSAIASRIAEIAPLSFVERILLAFVGFAIVALSILWHERGHIFAAECYGIGCSGIMLFGLGGIAFLKRPAKTSRAAFWIAIAGPIASFIASIGLFAGYFLLDMMFAAETLVRQMFLTFGILNFILGSFNLIPVFPLDGGRVLYSVLWALLRDEARGRQLCVRIGRIVIVAVFVFVLLPLVFIGTLHIASFFWYLIIAFLVWKMQSSALDRPLVL